MGQSPFWQQAESTQHPADGHIAALPASRLRKRAIAKPRRMAQQSTTRRERRKTFEARFAVRSKPKSRSGACYLLLPGPLLDTLVGLAARA